MHCIGINPNVKSKIATKWPILKRFLEVIEVLLRISGVMITCTLQDTIHIKKG